MSVHRALLVGLGRIAWRGFPHNPAAETHYQALVAHPSIRLIGGVDPNDSTRAEFQEVSSLLTYPTLQQALDDSQADMLVISSPVETHPEMVCVAATYECVRGILCEKPMALNVDECSRMAVTCYRRDKVLLVGHQRRYEQSHRMLRAFLKSETLGKPVGGRCTFPGEDWLNNGTHAADTMRFLLGDEVPFTLRMGKENTRVFQATVACQQGSVMLESYAHLVSGYRRVMLDDLIECMESDKHPECSADDGLEAVRATLAAEEVWRESAA